MSYIGPFTKEILDVSIKELKKKEVRDKLQKNLIDPIFREISSKIKPYITVFVAIQLIIILLLIYITTKV